MRVAALIAITLLAPIGPSVAADFRGWVGVPLIDQTPKFPVTDVVGQANAAAADALLEGDGFDLGATQTRCSLEDADVVIAQRPAAGTLAPLGALVDIVVSTGIPCRPRGANGIGVSIGVRL